MGQKTTNTTKHIHITNLKRTWKERKYKYLIVLINKNSRELLFSVRILFESNFTKTNIHSKEEKQ